MTKFLLIILLFTSCGKRASEPDISISDPYVDEEGKCLLNIGHRLGGDFRELEDNVIESAYIITGLQDNKCFRAWEFDINSTLDGIVLYHDRKLDGKKIGSYTTEEVDNLPTLEEFIEDFSKLHLTKRISVDLKLIRVDQFDRLLELALELKELTKVEVNFITNISKKEYYLELLDEAGEAGIGSGFYN